jgi:LPS-assembly lipoprotein
MGAGRASDARAADTTAAPRPTGGTSRRNWLARAATGSFATAAATLAGCGFRLRQPATFAFRTLAFSGFRPGSPLEAALRRAIARSGGITVAPSLTNADLVLEVLDDRHERSVVAVTAAGQVRELVLWSRLTMRVRRPDGRIAMPEALIEQRRDLSFTEAAALSKEREEAELLRAMDDDIADQVLRRLASIDRG